MRVVSLVPSHTESLHDMGFARHVVGRTRFCVAPQPWVQTVPHVGGTKDADLGRILALEPDLVVLDKDENPLALVQALQEAGVEVFWSEIDRVEDAADFLVELADRMGDRAAGEAVARQIRAATAALPHRDVPVWCPIWYDPWMTFDRTAYPHAMLAAVGLRNVFGGHEGPKYFEVAASDVAAGGADWTLLPTEPFPFHKRRDRIDLAPLGRCGRPDRVRIIDGEALTWFGTRTLHGLRELDAVAGELAQA